MDQLQQEGGPEFCGGLYPQICTLTQDPVETCLTLVCKHSPHRDDGKITQFVAWQLQIKVSQNIQQCWKCLRCLPVLGGRPSNIVIVWWIILLLINISLLKIQRQQTSVTASGSELTARKTSGCRHCEVSRRSGLVCDVKKAILPSRVKRE